MTVLLPSKFCFGSGFGFTGAAVLNHSTISRLSNTIHLKYFELILSHAEGPDLFNHL